MVARSSMKKLLAAVGAVVVGWGLCSASYGTVIASFQADPAATGFYEAQYKPSGSPTAVQLTENLDPATAGATGNHDVATAGGLTVTSPFAGLNLSPGGATYNAGYAPTNAGQSTNFYDVSLHMTDLTPAGPAQVLPLGGGMNMVAQLLNGGTVQLWSYSPSGTDPEYLLLQANVQNGVITGQLGQSTGGFMSADVSYTGGKIYDALAASLNVSGGTPIDGDLSWSFLSISPTLSVSGSPGNYTLNSFGANMTGLFNAVPEPGTLGLFAIGGIALGLRRRRK